MPSPNHRLAPVGYDGLEAAAKELWDEVATGRRGVNVPTRPGALGPYNALLYSPVVGRRFAALGESVRFDNSLDPRLRELVTLVVAAFYRAEFEWATHARWARRAGVDQDTIDALAKHEVPRIDDAEDKTVYEFASVLIETGRVPDAEYQAALDLLGPAGVVDLTALVGFYAAISLLINAFQVPLPETVAPIWDVPA
jgi:4-carboxymuconolactone decarboxylase